MGKKHKNPGRPANKWMDLVAIDNDGSTCLASIHQNSIGKWLRVNTPVNGKASNVDWTSYYLTEIGGFKMIRIWIKLGKDIKEIGVCLAKMTTVSPMKRLDREAHKKLLANLDTQPA